MTDKELSQYRKLIREAEDLQDRIDKLYDKDIDTAHSTVRGSAKSFPYVEFHMGVWVDDPKQVSDRDNMIAAYQERLSRARNEALRIEQFIGDIPDSELRQIFEYRYIDGKKLREIGDQMNMDFSGIGKKIRVYLNFPTIPQKS
jgi:DNA-directed RNA polymerase specialized sigma24 family protein